METAWLATTEACAWLQDHIAAAGLVKVLGFSFQDMLASFRTMNLPEVFVDTLGFSALIVSVLIGLLSLLYLLWCATTRKASDKVTRTMPGPRRYPLIGNTIEAVRNMHRNTEWVADILREANSSFCQLQFPGAKCLVVTDPRDVEHLLKTNFSNYPKGPEFHGLFAELLGNGIFNVDGEAWRLQRKVASHEFSTKSLKELMLSTFTRKVNGALVPLVGELAEKGTPFDLQEIFQRYTFDSICSIGFGVDPGCLAPGLPTIPFASAFDDAQEAHSHRFLLPPVVYKVKKLFGIGSEGRLTRAIKKVNEFAYGVIRQRREEMAGPSPKEREDLLSRFIAVADRENAPGTSGRRKEDAPSAADRFLRDIILNFILAGRDTTSVTLTWFFWKLTQNRNVEEKIVEEVERIAAAKGPGTSSSFDFEDIRQMTYLQAALSETLRLCPAVPSDVKFAIADDTFPSGATLKAGWRVAYHPFAQGHDPKVWGSDALDFKPERWIDEAGHFIQHSPYKFPSFQAGPRICLGKEMAYLQMKVVAASLLRHFKFRVVPGHIVTYRSTIVFTMKHGLQMTVERRK